MNGAHREAVPAQASLTQNAGYWLLTHSVPVQFRHLHSWERPLGTCKNFCLNENSSDKGVEGLEWIRNTKRQLQARSGTFFVFVFAFVFF